MLTTTPISESKLLIEIEQLTKSIIETDLNLETLKTFVKLANAFEKIYSCNYNYKDYVGVFNFVVENIQAFKKLDRGEYTYDSLLENQDDFYPIKYCEWLFKVNEKKAKEDIAQYNYRVKQRNLKLQNLVEYWFNKRSRNLIVRVDLKYKVQTQSNVNIEAFQQHVSTLRQRMADQDKCFKHLQAYAWCLEQGEEGGYHVHLFLMYDGSKCTFDCKLAKWVGMIWEEEITEGLGAYWNCHSAKNAYYNTKSTDHLYGLGMVCRDDLQGLKRLECVYSYLAQNTDKKLAQRLRIGLKKMKTFGYSQIPNELERGPKA